MLISALLPDLGSSPSLWFLAVPCFIAKMLAAMIFYFALKTSINLMEAENVNPFTTRIESKWTAIHSSAALCEEKE